MAESTIKQNLDNILEQRSKKAALQQKRMVALTQQWEISREKLNRIYSEFSRLEPEERLTICSSEDAACLACLQDKIRENDQAFQDAVKELNALATRYSRSTVNLVVIGAMGAGKSKFLQSASGLEDDCIPSHFGRSCTGVTSIIENCDVETEALFTFKTEEEAKAVMRREIARFARRIKAEDQITESNSFEDGVKNLEKLQALMNPASLKERENLKVIDESTGKESAMTDVDRNDLNSHLNSLLTLYKDRRKDWAAYLSGVENQVLDSDLEPVGNGRYVLRKKSKIQEYVSKHNGEGKQYYLYATIKKAVIRTRFKNGIDAHIRLIDTVGIGDPGIDTEERMLEAVNDKADGVIFILDGKPRYEKLDVKERELIEKFQEVYHTYSNREIGEDGTLSSEKRTKYWMAFLINNRFRDETKEDHGQKYLEEVIIKSFDGKDKLFGPEGIVCRKAINVGNSKEVEEMIAEFLQQISEHLQEIDSGMEASAEQARALALVRDETLWRRLRNIHINCNCDTRLNYIDQLYEERIGNLKQQLVELHQKMIADRKNCVKHTDSFLQQSLEKIRTLRNGGTLSGFFFAPNQEASLENMIQYYYDNVDSASYSTSFPNARLAVFQALQNVIREIGTRPLENQATAEIKFKHQIADACLGSLKLDREKLKDSVLDELDAQDIKFFEKLSKKLMDGLTRTEEIRKVFLSMDQFKLDKSNGITKALFNYFAAEHFVDSPYATPKVWPETDDTDRSLFLQELKSCLDDFIDSINERTSKEVYVKIEDNEANEGEYVTINGKKYRKELRKEAYLVDENDQMINELENFIYVMEPMHETAWKKIFSSLLDRKFLLEDTGRRERLAVVASASEELESLLRQT